MRNFRFLGAALLASLLSLTTTARAETFNKDRRGLALRGYDPVAYFTDGKPVAGKAEFTQEWRGATWRFASAEHRDAFAKEPEKFAPRFGGFCAYAVSKGYTYDADPLRWRIVDGRLYVNYNAQAQREWEKDVPGNIAKGEANWPKLKESR